MTAFTPARAVHALALAGLLLTASLALGSCSPKAKEKAVAPRPVRTVTAKLGGAAETVVLTGQISAENEAALSFRIGGRIIDRLVNVGDRVEPDQVLARLDPQNELNALRAAQAALSAAEGRVIETGNTFERQRTLLPQGFTTQANFDQAQQALRAAQAQLDRAEAELHIAKDRVSYTELRAGVSGSITARTAEAGEVVQPGQTVFQVAREDGRDAVFDVPAQVIRAAPSNPKVQVSLLDDASITAEGRIRQVDPQADPITRTFRVRVGLIKPPPAMFLGASVRGRMDLEATAGISLPASALTRIDGKPAVWLVDPAKMTVSLHNVEIGRFDPGTVLVSHGLQGGEVVVTAGVQALHPGQKVRLLGATP